MNTDFINMIRSDYPSAVKPNAGISFGWTVRPEKKHVPVWIHFGTGYNFSGAYHYTNEDKEEIHYQGGDVPEEKMKLSIYHAIPLEAGILLKIKRLAIRYTYQYRLPTSRKYDNYIEPSIHSIGIGF
jgi:hypothetical protein